MLYGGLTGKKKADFATGDSVYIPYVNVYNNIEVDFGKVDSVVVGEGEKQVVVRYGDVLITGSSETPDDCGMTSVVTCHPKSNVYLNSFCFGWRPNERTFEMLRPEYLKYAMRSAGVRRQITKCANGVTRFNMSKERFKRVMVPVPSIEEQERIVAILDRFEALTSSLSEGLPAEIKARRRQYEYYRDRLLDFPRKASAA